MSLTMMVLGPGHLVCALFHFPLKTPFVLSVSQIPLVVSVDYLSLVVLVEYFQLVVSQKYFSLKNFGIFKLRNFNIVAVCFCLALSFHRNFFNTMPRHETAGAIRKPSTLVAGSMTDLSLSVAWAGDIPKSMKFGL